jgi:hypothetical protein
MLDDHLCLEDFSYMESIKSFVEPSTILPLLGHAEIPLTYNAEIPLTYKMLNFHVSMQHGTPNLTLATQNLHLKCES